MKLWLKVGTVAVLLAACLVLAVFVAFADAFYHGPYASWYNGECQRLSGEAVLVGKPERDVVAILGPPTFHYPGDNDSRRTYNYVPWSMFPTAKFQVHCRNGVVTGVEQFDD